MLLCYPLPMDSHPSPGLRSNQKTCTKSHMQSVSSVLPDGLQPCTDKVVAHSYLLASGSMDRGLVIAGAITRQLT